MSTKKKQPEMEFEVNEPKDTKRYLAVIEDNYWMVGTLEEIKEWVLGDYDLDSEIELTELVGKPRKRKLNISLKF